MKYKGIEIIGNDKFTIQTKKTLNLIKDKSKKDFNKITKYLKTIRNAKTSGIDLNKSEYKVSNITAFHSIEWYASTIVHDTHHYYLHSTKRLIYNKTNAKKHEKLCLQEQIRFLKKIKASKDMISHCKKIIKTKYWIGKRKY